MIALFRRCDLSLPARVHIAGMTAMIDDEKTTEDPDGLPRARLFAANDNGQVPRESIDTRIFLIARALGRQIAREQLENAEAANDNSPTDE